MLDTHSAPVIKAEEIVYVRVRSPDLDIAEEFLKAIGLIRLQRTSNRLYMRGTGSDPYLHVTELGEPRCLSIGFRTPEYEDLQKLARIPGASEVISPDEPGGGRRVTVRDPNGYQVEVMCGAESLPVIPVPELLSNSATTPVNRQGRGPWGPDCPPQVKRFGHVVMRSTKFEESVAWYQQVLGLRCSDEVLSEDGKVVASFNRVDAGERFVDHHAVLLSRNALNGWHHISFEVQHWSDVFAGAAYLKRSSAFERLRPPNRHLVGGQVGAYVVGPWVRLHEFWADIDRVNASHEPRQWTIPEMVGGPQWDGGGFSEFRQIISA